MTNRSPRSLKVRRSRTVTLIGSRLLSRVHGTCSQPVYPHRRVRPPVYRAAVGREVGSARLVALVFHSCSPVGPPSPEEVDVRKYELMAILPAEADDKAVQGVTDRISQVLQEHGGQIGAINKWGRRRLAYELKRQSEGFYVVVEMQAEPDAVKELDRVLALADEILRFKVVVRAA